MVLLNASGHVVRSLLIRSSEVAVGLRESSSGIKIATDRNHKTTSFYVYACRLVPGRGRLGVLRVSGFSCQPRGRLRWADGVVSHVAVVYLAGYP